MARLHSSAQILSFPNRDTSTTGLNDHRQAEFEQLDQRIRHYQGRDNQPQWLEQYLDLGLELACQAGQKQLWALQESWLHRMYRTLRDSGLNLSASNSWRQACLDALYQPFFALRHLQRGQHDHRCRQRLHTILREFAVISRHLV